MAGGGAFILPNFLIVAALGAPYVHFGGLGWMTAIFYGLSPAVIVLIVHSCSRLDKLGMDDWLQWMESKQSVHRRGRDHWVNRLPNPSTDMDPCKIAKVESESENRTED